MLVLYLGGATQAPHEHEMVRVVLRFPDDHLPKKPAIGPQNVVRMVPHLRPLHHCYPRPACTYTMGVMAEGTAPKYPPTPPSQPPPKYPRLKPVLLSSSSHY